MAETKRSARRWLFAELARPIDVVQHLGPNWYATIMGTGIVANAASAISSGDRLLVLFSRWLWLADVVALVALSIAWVLHGLLAPHNAKRHFADPLMAQFFGAPPMALMTIGAGALAEGRYFLHGWAVAVDWVLWTAGALSGLVVAVAVPAAMVLHYRMRPEQTFASWLMPVVPPMVAAGTAGPLLMHAPLALRADLLYGCYAMFGAAAGMSAVVIALFWGRLATGAEMPAAMVPTMWIVLGPLGQSATAATGLGRDAGVLGAAIGPVVGAVGVLYSVVVLGFALLWGAIAAATTAFRVARGMPFALTWWSFTFPLGTVVMGAIGLARATHSPLFAGLATAAYVLLALFWALVAVRTAAASLSGAIFLPPDLSSREEPEEPEEPSGRAVEGGRIPQAA